MCMKLIPGDLNLTPHKLHLYLWSDQESAIV